MARYDLTYTMMNYLDRHQILHLLQFLQDQQLYNGKDLQQAKVQLVSATKMVDCAIEEYKELHGVDTIPKEMEERTEKERNFVFSELKRTELACGPLMELLKEDEDGDDSRPSLSLESLRSKKEVSPGNIEALFGRAKLVFDIGRYESAAKTLAIFRKLSDDEDKKFWALWGKLAAEILMVNCEVAHEDLKELRQEIDRQVFAGHLAQLQQRSWLVHWSLFIFFNLEGGLSAMMEFLLQEKLINTIQTQCPHILRYIACAVIINKLRKNVLKDVVKILISEKDAYSDPITQFVTAVYSEFDFERAMELLPECNQVAATDFFLGDNMADQFTEGARLLIFETACRIHKCIDLEKIQKYLCLEEDEADATIVKLISESNINANVDSANRQLIVATQKRTAAQVVIDLSKSRNLENRSNQLIAQVKKKYALLEPDHN